MDRARRLRVGGLATALCAVALLAPVGVFGQELTGRVFDADNQQGIQNAVVTLDGYGFRLTEASGEFRFDGVAAGDYVLTVEAFGYVTVARRVRIPAETSVSIALEPSALELDSLLIESRTIDFDGRVRDPRLDYSVKDARVTTDQGHEEWSNAHGRFDLDDVREGVTLRVVIHAFGYLPLDTAFVPDDDATVVARLAQASCATLPRWSIYARCPRPRRESPTSERRLLDSSKQRSKRRAKPSNAAP